MTIKAPIIYENWLAAQGGAPCTETVEVPLYTDAYITGEVSDGCGPYHLLNTVPGHTKEPTLAPSIVARIDFHTSWDLSEPMEKTDESAYHGGGIYDEIAALVSLSLGVRLKPGTTTRRFSPNGDAKGHPYNSRYAPEPSLAKNGPMFMLPNAIGHRAINDVIHNLQLIPRLRRETVISLVRAARLYQNALWIAESDAQTAWLQLISALETAANQWRPKKRSSVEDLIEFKPEIAKILGATGVAGLCEDIAKELAPTLGAQRTFMDFIFEYFPAAPMRRPPEHVQHPWAAEDLRKSIKRIYFYRSRALHGGKPFPIPMCHAPWKESTWEASEERPMGGATRSMGGTWLAAHTPMVLNTFEYLTRSVLLSWWDDLAGR